MPENHEWRVTYRRADWEDSTYDATRLYQSQSRALTQIGRLLDGDEYLSELTVLKLECRPVGEWGLLVDHFR